MKNRFRVTGLECKKLLRAPVLWILLLVFLAANVSMILFSTRDRDDMAQFCALAEEAGVVLDEKAAAKIEEICAEKTHAAARLYRERTKDDSLSDEEAAGALERIQYEGALTEEERAAVDQWELFSRFQEAIRTAQNPPMGSLAQYADEVAQRYELDGALLDLCRRQLESLAPRAEEIKESGESRTLAYPEWMYFSHQKLYGEMFRTLIAEGMFILLLLTVLSVHYESINRTAAVAYSTRRGRGLLMNKFFASLGVGMGAAALLFSATLWLFFSVYPYGPLWNSPVCSAMGPGGDNFAAVTWRPMTTGQYFWQSLLCGVLLLVVVFLLAFLLAVFVKNSYVCAMGFLLLMGLCRLAQVNIPMNSFFHILIETAPFSLLFHSGDWFIPTRTPLTAFQGFEWWSLLFAGLLFLAGAALAYARFRKRPL